MPHLHAGPGQHDLTVSAFIVRETPEGPRILLHRHKTLGLYLQPGGHVELDENPWAALLREIAEETGYAPGQLTVLQPPVRVSGAMGATAVLHPQPVSVLTHDLDAGGSHRHIDLGFAFLAGSEPAGHHGVGESQELMWVGTEELAALQDVPENVRTVVTFVLEQSLSGWEPIPVAQFALVAPNSIALAALPHRPSRPEPEAVALQLEVREFTTADRELLARLVELYFYDFSEFGGRDVQADGSYHYRWLSEYGVDDQRRAYLFEVDGHPAGFALVRLTDPIEMAEFFVLRKYRRTGIGTTAARQVLARHPGPWTISQIAANTPATEFWRRAIPVPFEERRRPDGSAEQSFSTCPAGTKTTDGHP